MHVHHAHGESFNGLARKRTAGGVAHGHRKHHLDGLDFVFGSACGLGGCNACFVRFAVGAEGGFRVQRIENRFNEDGVNALFHEDFNLFQIRIFEFVKSNGATCRVVHVFAHGEHLACGADVAQNIDLATVLLETLFGGLLRDLHRGAVHLGDTVFLVVFMLAHALARERVRGEAIHACIHVAALDVENYLGLFNREHIVVRALDTVSLDNRTHAAIEQHHL